MAATNHHTRGEQAVLDALDGRSQPLSAQEIFMELRESDRPVGLATVYRAITSLKDSGFLQQLDLEDNQAYYQLAVQSSHSSHHLICTSCRRVQPLPSCPVSALEHQLSEKYDFKIERHVLDFYGVCAACRD